MVFVWRSIETIVGMQRSASRKDSARFETGDVSLAHRMTATITELATAMADVSFGKENASHAHPAIAREQADAGRMGSVPQRMASASPLPRMIVASRFGVARWEIAQPRMVCA
jgi:hypothetical protein